MRQEMPATSFIFVNIAYDNLYVYTYICFFLYLRLINILHETYLCDVISLITFV
jgi:hypothetical protein